MSDKKIRDVSMDSNQERFNIMIRLLSETPAK